VYTRVSIPQAGSGLFSPTIVSCILWLIVEFQSLKREAAYLAHPCAKCSNQGICVSIPQAGSGLFSLDSEDTRKAQNMGFNPSSGKRPI